MKDFFSFAQALESKIRADLQAEGLAPTHSSVNITQSIFFESLNVPTEFWGSSKRVSSIEKKNVRPTAHRAYQVKPKPLPPLPLTPEEQVAFDWLNLKGAQLPNPFSSKELTRAKKILALKLHPDKGGAAEEFIQFQNHWSVLRSKWATLTRGP